jgi:hypothetical protein
MHHKFGKPRSARAGCKMCKPQKANGMPKLKLGHRGFGKLRREIAARRDQRDDVA